MKGYTKIPNNMLIESQLTVSARYLYCVLLRYCGKDEWCYPSQKTLAKDLGCSDRHIRDLIKELETQCLVYKKRKGYNRANNYKVAKSLTSDRKFSSTPVRNNNSALVEQSNSVQLGSTFPIHEGITVPPNSTYLKGKDNNTFNHKAFEKFRQDLIKKKLIPDKKLTVNSQTPLS